MLTAEVLINLPATKFNHAFFYAVPEHLAGQIEFGQRVLVEFNGRLLQAYVVGVKNEETAGEIKPVLEILDPEPVFDQKLLGLAQWLADYYLCTVPLALKTIIPGIMDKKGPAEITARFGVETLAEVTRQNPGLEELLKKLAEVKSMEIKAALEFAAYDELIALAEQGIISIVQKYSAYRPAMTDYVYSLGIMQNDKWEQMQKRAPRQAEAIKYLMEKEFVDKKVLESIIPAASLKVLLDKGCIKLEKKRPAKQEEAKILTGEQSHALAEILALSKKGVFQEILLFGVTGSGKTEIYLRAAEEIIKKGRKVIVLVPEIALTSHLVDTFAARIENLAVIHSAVLPSERYQQFKQIKNGEIDLVLGTRSAIFAPLPDIGLIILDEEQESSYKNEETPKYHARDAARKRAEMDLALMVLGTATPATDTFYKAVSGKTGLLILENRPGQAELPRILIADRRGESGRTRYLSLSPLLQEKLTVNIKNGEQSILLINRRGYSPVTICRQCGNIFSCPSCSVAMTYHQDLHKEICHYCGYEKEISSHCPECGSKYVQQLGYGTQKVEEEIKILFPEASIARLDMDVSMKKGQRKEILSKMKTKQIDILVGTQMVAKGFDFPDVSLVGIIDIDNMLNFPDYRAAERCFQLIVQAAGRAGRAQLPGEVVIQTYNGDHEVIKFAARQDYFNFYTYEISNRRILEYPPFKEILRIVISSSLEAQARNEMGQLKMLIEEIVDATETEVDILGPAPAPHYKIKDRYRYQILIKADDFWLLNSIGKQVLANRKDFKAKMELDINPVNII
ncbi:MAG TPA: primosomal protein N' [Syntrophomonadaceae bacterium]|nr:primosomal protein N' [Syntrophomonadaceae bacterium]HPR93761.1 primosomal protein N' [Syntrophomonadaceae bacterium]